MDISRLLERSYASTPTGIDRYELHYAGWFSDRHGLDAMAPSFVQTGRRSAVPVPSRRANGLIRSLRDRWATTQLSPDQERLLARIFAAIDGRIPWQRPQGETARRVKTYRQALQKASALAAQMFPVAGMPPADASLLHVSHSRLERAEAFSWLGSRRSSIFYVHDLIQLSHPEYVRTGEPVRHRRRMETVLRHAALVLCNSQLTARSLRTFAQENNRAVPSIAVLPPGVEDCFATASQDVSPVSMPYFVIVGTIEPRKNHMLLLHLWQYLAERDGRQAPRLVIVGKRGWENTHILAMLERSRRFSDLVIEVPGLEDAALARLIAGATALLSPSFVEGYGMPIAEARALGVPVVCSNISAHREVAGSTGILLDPLDGRGWRNAIDALAAAPKQKIASTVHRWNSHFADLEMLIEDGFTTQHYAAQRARRPVFQAAGSFSQMPAE
jgi:glycosyltransferase involved in cell wall biosynthesis